MDLGLQGRVAVITGPAKGMGAAVSLAFALEGCRLALIGRDIAAIEPVAQEIRAGGGEAIVVHCDITGPAECERGSEHQLTAIQDDRGEEVEDDCAEDGAGADACGDTRQQAGQARTLARVVQPHRGHADEHRAGEQDGLRQHRTVQAAEVAPADPRIQHHGQVGGEEKQDGFGGRQGRQRQLPVVLENSNGH